MNAVTNTIRPVVLLSTLAVLLSVSASAQQTNFIGSIDRGLSYPFGSGITRSSLTPDGRWLACYYGTAWRQDLLTGEVEILARSFVDDSLIPLGRASISDDGHSVAFEAWSDLVVPGDTNGYVDVFVKDMTTGAIQLVSESWIGEFGTGWNPTISGNGSTIVFYSDYDGLTPGAVNGWVDVYAYDVATQALELISVDRNGQAPAPPPCYPLCQGGATWLPEVDITPDGRFVAFETWALDLTPEPGVDAENVYVRDRLAGVTELISVTPQGRKGTGESYWPSISANGRFVAFASTAPNLVVGGTTYVPGSGGRGHVYVRDRVLQTTTLVSQSILGEEGDNWSEFPTISRNGRKVAFKTSAKNLVDYPGPAHPVLLLAHLQSGEFSYLLDAQSTPLSGSAPIALAGNGVIQAFAASPPLTPIYNDMHPHVFLRDERVPFSPIVRYCTSKTNSLGCAPAMGTAGIASFTHPTAFFVTSVRQRSGQQGAMLWSLAPAALPFQGGYVCVSLPARRTPIQSSGGWNTVEDCTGGYSFPFSTSYAQLHGLSAGDTVYAQYWSRDPSSANPQQVNVSDGISFTWAP